MTTNKVVIYARVSTQEQAEEGYSIDAQIDTITKKCEAEGKSVVAVYADRGISGKSTANRLELKQLLEDSEKNLFDEVVVWKTSRMARNILDLLQIVSQLESNGVTFKSITEPYDTSTPTGKLMLNLLGSIGEFERVTTIENLKLGQRARVKSGLRSGAKLYGYKNVGVKKDSRLEIIPEQAMVICRIFEMYVSGKGYKAISNMLNKEGYRTMKGNLFSIAGIKCIICNEAYYGKVTYGKYVDWSTKRRKGKAEDYLCVDGLHEAIISEDMWNKAQEIRKVRSDKYPRSYSGEFPLTGLIRCPQCGYGMVAARTVNTLKDGTKKSIRYYSCGKFRSQGSVACRANSVRADEAENYVFGRIKEIMLNSNLLKDLVDKLNKDRLEKIKPLEIEKASIDKHIETNLAKKNRVFGLYEDGLLSKVMLTERLNELEMLLEQLGSKKIELMEKVKMNSSEPIPFEVVQEAMSDFNTLLSQADKDQRKLLLQMIIDKITVGDNHKIDTIEIHFNETIQSLLKSYKGDEPIQGSSPSCFVFKFSI